MSHSYVAYIDESGDDGLRKYREPGAQGGSSNWLILSACVFRRANSLAAVGWRNEVIERVACKQKRLHFVKLEHEQKVVAAQVVGRKPIRAISVLVAKRHIQAQIYTTKNQLYFYMARYLIERISWVCRDLRPNVPEGDGRVAITFSTRGGMSYPHFREYLKSLKANGKDVQVYWPVIDIDGINAIDHSCNAGLQLADVIASSFAAGVEPNIYGNCQTRFAELLKPIVYKKKNNYLSYGVKIVPSDCTLSAEQNRFVQLYK